jgi:alkanesulfonate monooxygenase SsuD/methylene tetrahydromethanopterin reductase-like flavin-dependent oxidoreductase (luciferase family)
MPRAKEIVATGPEYRAAMRVRLMIEGQEDVTWEQWLGLARACEEHGVEALFRSDHYRGSLRDPGGSLDAWTTLAGLAAVTSKVRLGTMVSPVTFRPAAVLAKTVVTVDHISNGRVELGIGAGWNEREHEQHGFPFPPTPERIALFAQQVESIVHHWTDDEDVLPKPVQKPHPPLIVGGSAKPGTLGPAVRFADEYNTYAATLDDLRERRARLDGACGLAGRDPGSIRFTLMETCVIGRDRRAVAEALQRVVALPGAKSFAGGDPPAHWLVGTPDELADRLRTYAEVIDAVYLQHLLHEELEAVELIGRELAPALAN